MFTCAIFIENMDMAIYDGDSKIKNEYVFTLGNKFH